MEMCVGLKMKLIWVAFWEYGDRLTVEKIDHDANPKLIEEYKVYRLPALILFKDGKEVPESRREGAITNSPSIGPWSTFEVEEMACLKIGVSFEDLFEDIV